MDRPPVSQHAKVLGDRGPRSCRGKTLRSESWVPESRLPAGGGWFFNTFTGDPADANIGAGIMVLAGFTIAGALVLVAWAIAAGFQFKGRRATT